MLFQQGVEAADSGRWDEARALFAETYELLPRPQVLLNLAGALAQTGRIVAAVDAYRRVEALGDAASEPLREAARSARTMLEPRLAYLQLDFHDTLAEGDDVQLDDVPLARGTRGDERAMDPGRHSIVVRRDGVEVLREDFRLYEGERLRLDLRAPEPEPSLEETPVEPLRAPTRDDTEWFESPIFWTVLGVVVAGSVAIGVAVAVDDTEEPFVGNLGAVRVR